MALLRRTGVGRDINRPYHSSESLEAELESRWSGHSFICFDGGHRVSAVRRRPHGRRYGAGPSRHAVGAEGRWAELRVDLADRTYEVDVDGVMVTAVDDLRIG